MGGSWISQQVVANLESRSISLTKGGFRRYWERTDKDALRMQKAASEPIWARGPAGDIHAITVVPKIGTKVELDVGVIRVMDTNAALAFALELIQAAQRARASGFPP